MLVAHTSCYLAYKDQHVASIRTNRHARAEDLELESTERQHSLTWYVRDMKSVLCDSVLHGMCRLIATPFWLVLIIAGLTCNGGTWFDTACLVTSVRNFPNERGTVVGLLKACVGASPRLVTLIPSTAYLHVWS